MATLANILIDRIDFHIEMIEEDIKDSIDHAANLSDADAEVVAYDLKRIRNLKQLQESIKITGKAPANLRETMMSVIEEMMDLDLT